MPIYVFCHFAKFQGKTVEINFLADGSQNTKQVLKPHFLGQGQGYHFDIFELPRRGLSKHQNQN